MAEMPAAAPAMDLGADEEEQGAIYRCSNRPVDRSRKARPAGAAVEFGVGAEQRQVTPGTCKNPLAVLLIERTGSGRLGAMPAQDVELGGRQARAPFRFGQVDLECCIGRLRPRQKLRHDRCSRKSGCQEKEVSPR